MRIAVLTSGLLPIPAVQGGAVENLIDFYLEYNNIHRQHDITVYSISHYKTKGYPALLSTVNHYYYIDVDSIWAKIKRRVYYLIHGNEYHHFFIEYYLEQSIKHIRKQNYDCIILENRPSYALKLRNLTNSKLIYHLHNEKLTMKTPSYQDIYDAGDLIICVSDFVAQSVKVINPNDKKCVVVHNGIDLSSFSNPTTTINREKIGLNQQDFIIVYSGRINPEKGIRELTEAMFKLRNYPQIKLMVIGNSFFGNITEDDSFTKELRNSVESIKENIIFTGFIPYESIPSYLKLADIAVVPSMWDEPFGLTVLEAMAAGLPLITTKSGGIPEICDGVACIIERDNIIDNLANSIMDLYQNPTTRINMSIKSRNRSLHFSKEEYAYLFFKVLETSNT